MCRKLRVPFSVDTIIETPVDEFNALLRKHPLNARQRNLVRDIRRRGKNKVRYMSHTDGSAYTRNIVYELFAFVTP